MDYFDYREMRSLILRSRLLRYQIDLERKESKPNIARISKLKKLRFTTLERIAGYLKQHSQTQGHGGGGRSTTASFAVP